MTGGVSGFGQLQGQDEDAIELARARACRYVLGIVLGSPDRRRVLLRLRATVGGSTPSGAANLLARTEGPGPPRLDSESSRVPLVTPGGTGPNSVKHPCNGADAKRTRAHTYRE